MEKIKINKKGFVLMETIVVITVLCVILVVLYASYFNLLISVKKKRLYDNTEYIYKTEVVREYLEKELEPESYNNSTYMVYCRNANISSDSTIKKCYDKDISNNFENELFKTLGVEAIYITWWYTPSISPDALKSFEATTQNYIKSMDPTDESGYRIIGMYKSENNETEIDTYEYASLRFGSRV